MMQIRENPYSSISYAVYMQHLISVQLDREIKKYIKSILQLSRTSLKNHLNLLTSASLAIQLNNQILWPRKTDKTFRFMVVILCICILPNTVKYGVKIVKVACVVNTS